MIRIQQLNIYLITISLALANIVWFADFTLGTVKISLMILILLLNINEFLNPRNYVGFFWFFVLSPFLALTASTSQGTVDDKLYWLYGFVENYFFLMLGYICFSRGENVGRMLRMILPFTLFFSLLILSNFFTGVPEWFSPITKAAYKSAVNGGYTGAEMAPMYSTGFGIARTGWATTLSSYLPLTLLLFRNKKVFYIAYVMIATTIILSASRGGLFLALLITAILFVKSNRGGAFKAVALLSLFAIFAVILPYVIDIERFLRLSGG